MLTGGRLDVITIRDAGRWDETLDEAKVCDFYHLSSYHRLAHIRGEGDPLLIVFRDGGHVIAFPALLRDIKLPVAAGVSGFRDVTSVYGYAGPLASSEGVPEAVRLRFASALQDFYESQHVVCAFSRLHPLINQSAILTGYGQIADVGVTTSIDLTVPEDVQLARYRTNHRRDIKALNSSGFTCEEAGIECLDDFVHAYADTMIRVNAEGLYFFERSYFDYLMREMSDVVHLFVCRNGSTVVGGGLFTLCRGIIQYHLGGTDSDYQGPPPLKLVIDAVRMWGNRVGAETLHLGGGVGAQRDSLHHFKVGFCGREHVFSVWKHVVMPAVYEELCREARRCTDIEVEGCYFPAYRDPAFQARPSSPTAAHNVDRPQGSTHSSPDRSS